MQNLWSLIYFKGWDWSFDTYGRLMRTSSCDLFVYQSLEVVRSINISVPTIYMTVFMFNCMVGYLLIDTYGFILWLIATDVQNGHVITASAYMGMTQLLIIMARLLQSHGLLRVYAWNQIVIDARLIK